jgi:hypothetical protein
MSASLVSQLRPRIHPTPIEPADLWVSSVRVCPLPAPLRSVARPLLLPILDRKASLIARLIVVNFFSSQGRCRKESATGWRGSTDSLGDALKRRIDCARWFGSRACLSRAARGRTAFRSVIRCAMRFCWQQFDLVAAFTYTVETIKLRASL